MKLFPHPWFGRCTASLLATALAVGLAACGGGGGGSATPPAAIVTPPATTGISTGATGLAAASSLTITVTKVSISGPPVVDFVVTNGASEGMTGLVAGDLRFNIAKLVPSASGGPADWQNYINRVSGGAVQGSQERVATGYPFGTLVGHGGGAYTYTFATDITSPAANPCPAPCTDASGKALDLSYAPALTHRVTIQQANRAYPVASGVYDFVPAGGGVITERDVVATATCNSCHAQLQVHGTRVDTRLCVTCHNPGSWVAGSPNQPVDFKVMVHRIHYNNAGAALPSVIAGTPYKIGSSDFSAVTFPAGRAQLQPLPRQRAGRGHDRRHPAGQQLADRAQPRGLRRVPRRRLFRLRTRPDQAVPDQGPRRRRDDRRQHLRQLPRGGQVHGRPGHRRRAQLPGAPQGGGGPVLVQHPRRHARPRPAPSRWSPSR